MAYVKYGLQVYDKQDSVFHTSPQWQIKWEFNCILHQFFMGRANEADWPKVRSTSAAITQFALVGNYKLTRDPNLLIY